MAAGEAGLLIAEISGPMYQPPRRLATFDTPGWVYSLCVNSAGTIAYVADGEAGVQVLAATNWSNPVLLGSLDTAGSARYITTYATEAYVADGTAGIQILSLTNPIAPVRVGGYNTGGEAVGLAFIPGPEGRRLYVATRHGGLVILNVNNSANPTLLGRFSPGSDINGVALDGYIAYLSAGDSGLIVVTTTNTAVTSPIVLAAVDMPGYAQAISRYPGATRIQVANGAAGVSVFEITNAASPRLLGSFDTVGDAIGVAATPTYSYVADGTAGLQVWQVTDPASPERMGQLNTMRRTTGVKVTGTVAVVANEDYGITTMSVDNPKTPREIGNTGAMDPVHGVGLQGGLALAASGDFGIQTVSLTNLDMPHRLGTATASGYALDAVAFEDYALVASEIGGLLSFSITNPAAPALVGSYDTFGWANRVRPVGNVAYVADSFSGLVVLSMTNPAAPALLGQYDAAAVFDVSIRSNLAYTVNSSIGFTVLDISNPANIVEIGHLGNLGFAQSLALADHYAYVGVQNDGVKVVDISHPESPVLVGAYDTPGRVVDLVADGHFLYVADDEWGLTILRLVGTNHAPPVFTLQPVSQFGVVGGTCQFTGAAVGADPLLYQWYFGTTPLQGETNTTLTVANLALSAAGDYSLVVTNSLGSVTSQVAQLTILPAGSSAGWFVMEDRSTLGNWKGVYGTQSELIFGAVTNLAVNVIGGGYYTFSGNTPAPAALERPGLATATDRFSACQYSPTSFSCDITLPSGTTNRLAAYAMEPAGARLEQVDLVDIPTGTILDSRVIGNLTNGVYLVWDVTGPVRVRVTRLNGANAVLSGLFVGTATAQAPVIREAPPVSLTAAAGSSVYLGAGASGTPALSFRWEKDGVALTDTSLHRGCATPVLGLAGVTPADAGNYRLRVTNALGQVLSTPASLYVTAVQPEKARFVLQDSTTRGNWKGVYGTVGHLIYGLSTNFSAGLQVSTLDGDYFGISTNTFESTALEYPGDVPVTTRFSAMQYAANELNLSFELPAEVTNRIVLYFMEGGGDRVQRVEVLDATTPLILDSRTIAGLTNGIYLNYDVRGSVRVRVSLLAGANVILNGVFVGAATNEPPSLRAQPPAQIVAPVGSSTVLGVGAHGTPALRFQWQRNGQPLSEAPLRVGTASPTRGLWDIQTTNTGAYAVVITNRQGRLTSPAVNLVVTTPDAAKATLVLQDNTTMGNWQGVYGSAGHLIFGAQTNLPAEVHFTFSNATYYAFANSTADPRALERPGSSAPTNRFSAAVYAASAITVDAALPTGVTNTISLYFMEPGGGRAQRVDVFDPATGILIDSQYLPALTNGSYLTWNVNGPVRFQVVRTAGANALLSGIFLGVATTPTMVRVQPPSVVTVPAAAAVTLGAAFTGQPALRYQWSRDGQPLTESPTRIGVAAPVLLLTSLQGGDSGNYSLRATGPASQISTESTLLTVLVADPAKGRFVAQDSTTLGNWKGVYGTEGHFIVGNSTNWADPNKHITVVSGNYFPFDTNSAAAFALERADTTTVTNRFSACLYDADTLLLNISLPSGSTNRVAVYFMEPQNTRTERVELLDATGLTVLDTRTVSNLNNAVYLTYDINGPAKLRVTRLSGGNAILSGIFIGTAVGQAPGVRVQPPANVTTTVGSPLILGAGISGAPALQYRWFKDGLAVNDSPNRSGSTKPLLTFLALEPADAGTYALVVTNPVGIVTSATAIVRFPPPVWFAYADQDASTLGNWQGVYGTKGYWIAGLATNYALPGVQILPDNGTLFAFYANTPDANALERPGSTVATDRYSACQYDANALLLTVNLPSGITNRIAFYLMEPGVTRTERFELLDPTGTAVLDSRMVGSLSNAVYLVYDVATSVKARITRTAGANAVISAVFVGAAEAASPSMRIEPPGSVATTNGGRLLLGASITGTPALGYQWTKDGVPLADGPQRTGSQKPVLDFGGLQTSDAGGYALVITNSFGVVTSRTSVVTISAGAPALGAPVSIGVPAVRGDLLHFTIIGEVGATYRLETATDLHDWKPCAEVKVITVPTSFTLPLDAADRMRFFRALRQ